MLVLTRTINEKIVIGDDVTLTVLGVKGKQVKFAIEAPLEIPVHREEIYQRILLVYLSRTTTIRTRTRMARSWA